MCQLPWIEVFKFANRSTGATEAELQSAVRSIPAPITQREIELVAEIDRPAFPPGDPLAAFESPRDPLCWHFPTRNLPEDYLDLLRWSNGGEFSNERVAFFPLFRCDELRGYMLVYFLPQYMPGTLPIGMDGGGGLYLLDLRNEDRYSVLFAAANALGFDECETKAQSVWELCSGTSLATAVGVR